MAAVVARRVVRPRACQLGMQRVEASCVCVLLCWEKFAAGHTSSLNRVVKGSHEKAEGRQKWGGGGRAAGARSPVPEAPSCRVQVKSSSRASKRVQAILHACEEMSHHNGGGSHRPSTRMKERCGEEVSPSPRPQQCRA